METEGMSFTEYLDTSIKISQEHVDFLKKLKSRTLNKEIKENIDASIKINKEYSDTLKKLKKLGNMLSKVGPLA